MFTHTFYSNIQCERQMKPTAIAENPRRKNLRIFHVRHYLWVLISVRQEKNLIFLRRAEKICSEISRT